MVALQKKTVFTEM